MRELAVLAFVTLDGVMQAPSSPDEDRSAGFDLGGWASPYWDDVMPHVERTAMSTPYDILFGRKTFDLFAAHWQNAGVSVASKRLNAAQKHVVTSKPLNANWPGSQVLKGDVVDAVAELKAQDGPLLQIHGSATLIQTLFERALIDEFRLWTFPVVLGAGKRLFEHPTRPLYLELRSFDRLTSGVLAQVYRTDAS